MAISTESIVGIVLVILIVIIIIVVIMVLVTNARMTLHDAMDSKDNSAVVIIKPCFKPCGCSCYRDCKCHALYNVPVYHDSSCSDSSSSSSSSSNSSGYSCTPPSDSTSSSDSVSISSESISPDACLSRIKFDRKPPCPDSTNSSSSSSSSTVSPFSIDFSDSKKCHGALGVVNVEAPQLNCVTVQDNRIKSTCGNISDGEYFIQWYPVNQSVVKYTVYVGRGEVGVTNYVFKYDVAPDSHYLLTPAIGKGPYAFVVTATVTGVDGVEIESAASESFESP